ncbi:MAG: GntR family transcriptional regulator [Candidatus Dormibacteria bacterium]
MEPDASNGDGYAPVAFENLTLSQRVYQHLREAILTDQLLPGTELSEVALASELGVSRGPIREAIGRLAAEGLVTVRPRRGSVVRSLTTDELIDAYQVREALEAMAVRLAVPRLTRDDLALLEQLLEKMAISADREDITEFFHANIAFHESFVRLSGNQKLLSVYEALRGEMGRLQQRSLLLRGDPKKSVSEHRAILRAAKRGDVEGAVSAAAQHVRVPAENLRRRLDSTPKPPPSSI